VLQVGGILSIKCVRRHHDLSRSCDVIPHVISRIDSYPVIFTISYSLGVPSTPTCCLEYLSCFRNIKP